MDCHQIAKQGLVVLYVNGTLKPSLQTDYEIHILECQKCSEDLENVQAMRAALISPDGLDKARQLRSKSPRR
jgi:hypothetical protein